MTRKKLILIIVISIIVVLGVWIVTSVKNNSTGTSGTQGDGLGSLFPFFGSSSGIPSQNTDSGSAGGTTPDTTSPTTTATSPLKHISNKVVAGFTVIVPPNTTPFTTIRNLTTSINPNQTSTTSATITPTPQVRFLEKGTGYVYDTTADGTGEKKITGTAIVRSLDALFANNGNTVAVRYIKNDNQTLATFIGQVPAQVDEDPIGELKGDFLPDNILDLVVAPDGKSFLYLLTTSDGVVGLSMKTDGTAKKQVFTSPFSEWLLDWTPTALTATTKASSAVPGYAYTVQKSGFFQKILGNVTGLTTKMSPDGKNLVYSVTTNGKLGLYVLHTKDGSGASLGLSTLPEKCVWAKDAITLYCAVDESSPTGDLPDSWYQGITHFNDSIWKIDTVIGTTTKVIDTGGIDATKLTLDPTEKYLLFINKNDGGLWSLDLNPTPTI